VHLDLEVDAVEERAREPSEVPAARHGAAAAVESLPDRQPARARVGREHELEARGVPRAPGRALDDELAVLERLTKSLEHPRGELGRLVHEEHTSVRPGRRSGSRHA
jgi:hypothetical protein